MRLTLTQYLALVVGTVTLSVALEWLEWRLAIVLRDWWAHRHPPAWKDSCLS